MAQFETLLYEEAEGVARVTLNRPEVHNAFNMQMQRELHDLWRGLRHNDDVRVVMADPEGVLCASPRHPTSASSSSRSGPPAARRP